MLVRAKASLYVTGIIAALAVIAGPSYAADSPPVAAVPKVESFDPATYAGETGQVVLPLTGQFEALLLRKVQDGKPGDYLQVTGKDAALTVPVGSYEFTYCTVNASGKDGGWTYSRTQSSAVKTQILEVKAGGRVAIETSGELAESVKAGKTGKVTLPYSGASSVQLYSADEMGSSLVVRGNGNVLEVPAGVYRLTQYSGTMTGKDNTKLLITVNNVSHQDDLVNIDPGTNIKLKSSEPFVASVKVAQNGDKVNMSLAMLAANGDTCTVRPVGIKATLPGFKVLSKAGKVLMSGNFAYG